MNKKALLVVNFHSGTGKSREALPGIIEILSDAGTEVSVYSTKNKLSTIQKVKNSASSYDSIIAVGGDGTLSETVNGVMLAGSDVAVGYVPVGSTNDTARFTDRLHCRRKNHCKRNHQKIRYRKLQRQVFHVYCGDRRVYKNILCHKSVA